MNETGAQVTSDEVASCIRAHDADQATLVNGALMYLWQHNDCPGQHNKGCFKMSCYQALTINDNLLLWCHIRDTKLSHKKTKKFVRPIKIKHWSHVSITNNAHLAGIAGTRWTKAMNTDRGCWLNGVLPEQEI